MSLYISILLTSSLALYCLYRSKLTIPAVVFGWFIGVAVGYYGGYFAFIALFMTCVLVLISDKVKKTKKDDTRTAFQLIGTIFVPAVCIAVYYLFEIEVFYITYYAVLATSLGDTLSSGLGPLSKKKPINIFTLEKVEKGDSGGITTFGTIMSAFGGIIVGGIYFIQTMNIIPFIIIIILSIIGSFVDSVLGLIFQAQYRCIACKKVIEESKHCRKKAKLIRGYPYINNSLVNLMSNLAILLISYLIFYIIL